MRTKFQSNPIELNLWVEFDWVRQSNEIELTENKKKSNPNERSIFKLVICVKQASKILNQILDALVRRLKPGVAHVFFVNKEILKKFFQMRCGLLGSNA